MYQDILLGHLADDGLFAGTWEEDLQEGMGKCKWADGAAYDGQWRQGNRWASYLATVGSFQTLVFARQASSHVGR